MQHQRIYAIKRRYTVEDYVYVGASSAREATAKAKDGDWLDATDADTVTLTRYSRPEIREAAYVDHDGQVRLS